MADFDEIRTLASAMGEAGHGIMQATIGRELFLRESAEIAGEIHRPITYTALLAGMNGPGGHRGPLEASQKLCDEGLSIIPQVTCRPLNFEFQFKAPFIFESMSLFAPVSAADFEGKKKIYADPEFRSAFKSKAGEGSRGAFANRWDRTVISFSPTDPTLEKRNLNEVARARALDPTYLALDLPLPPNLQPRFTMAIPNIVEHEAPAVLHYR